MTEDCWKIKGQAPPLSISVQIWLKKPFVFRSNFGASDNYLKCNHGRILSNHIKAEKVSLNWNLTMGVKEFMS